jgi:hypothetical protein
MGAINGRSQLLRSQMKPNPIRSAAPRPDYRDPTRLRPPLQVEGRFIVYGMDLNSLNKDR